MIFNSYFYASEIEDRGAYCFCPVCHSVILSSSLNFNLANNFWTVSARAFIFHMNIPCDNTFLWVPLFYPVTLTLEFDPFFDNFNLANNFWIVSARALIFHMSIPCDETFLWFHDFLINVRAFILHMSISCDKIFLLVSRYLSLWPWPSLELGHLCFTNTSCLYMTYSINLQFI